MKKISWRVFTCEIKLTNTTEWVPTLIIMIEVIQVALQNKSIELQRPCFVIY